MTDFLLSLFFYLDFLCSVEAWLFLSIHLWSIESPVIARSRLFVVTDHGKNRLFVVTGQNRLSLGGTTYRNHSKILNISCVWDEICSFGLKNRLFVVGSHGFCGQLQLFSIF